MPGGFSPLPHVGHEISEADKHVESHDDVLSDAGSTPAASTIPRWARSAVGAGVRLSAIALRARPSSATPAASTNIDVFVREFALFGASFSPSPAFLQPRIANGSKRDERSPSHPLIH